MEVAIELNVPQGALYSGGAPKVVQEELVAATEFAVNLAQATIVPLTPIDTGLLRGGIQTSVSPGPVDIVGRVFNPLAYALPVEMGTAPHFPPPAALEAWGRRKLGQEGLGFVLARAISKRGTKGAFMFKRGLEACRGRIEGRYAEAMARVVARLGAE